MIPRDSTIKGVGMNLGPMFAGAALVALLGYVSGRRIETRVAANCAMILALAMIMWRGFYWNLFGRGDGFFTANRMTALLLLFVVFGLASYQGAKAGYLELRRGE